MLLVVGKTGRLLDFSALSMFVIGVFRYNEIMVPEKWPFFVELYTGCTYYRYYVRLLALRVTEVL